MTQVIATVQHAAQWASRREVPKRSWNPVYRALVDDTATLPMPMPMPNGLPDESSLDLVLRQLAAPALLVVAVTDGETGREQTRRLRIGLAPATATIEQADDDQPSRWSEVGTQEVPARVTSLLEEAGVRLAPPQLSIERDTDALHLTPTQHRLTHAALRQGLTPEEAFTTIPDLDDPLQDALTANGPRISFALTLHDPRGLVTERPVTWSRLWVTGRKGLYRLDQPSGPALAVHVVGAGDMLGTLIPVLEQGLRFAAACAGVGALR